MAQQDIPQGKSIDASQAISLENICMIDGSWTSTAQFSGCGWVWIDTSRKTQLVGTRNLRRRELALHSEVEALWWAMESMLQHSPCQRFGKDCKDLLSMLKDLQTWPRFATELEAIKTLMICFSDFKISHIPKTQNGVDDSLARIARSFYKEMCYIGYSIPVWLHRPPQVWIM